MNYLHWHLSCIDEQRSLGGPNVTDIGGKYGFSGEGLCDDERLMT